MTHALIIEDELMIALTVQDMLEQLGVGSFDMVATEHAAVASAQGRRPDIILADVRLAAGSGPDAVRRIVAMLGPIPVIYATGNPEAAHSDPAAPVLVKPISEEALRSAYRRLMPA